MASGGSRPEDTTLTKIFVGGLAWETRRDGLRAHFEKFGEVDNAVVVTDGITARSRGYGFVTFKDAEAARKACEEDPYPVIEGRRANCNLASLGAKKNRPYATSPHPGWEKWRQGSGSTLRSKPRFNHVAPSSAHIPQSGTWEARAYPTYQYPAYSHSLYTMNYYNTYGGHSFPTYYRPQYLNYYPLYQRYGQTTPGTTHYRKSGHYPVLYGQFCRPQFSSTSIPELPSPAVTAERNREGKGATSKGIDREQSA